MAQLNLNTTPEFERRLARLMRLRGIGTKSEAIRLAVTEAVEREISGLRRTDFRAWKGRALEAPLNPTPRFRTHDDLWK